jgi:hypothetical protein
MLCHVALFRAVLVQGFFIAATQAQTPKEPVRGDEVRVKTTTVGLSSTRDRVGIVSTIDTNGLTLVEIRDGEEPHEHRILPIDHLRAGKVLPGVFPRSAYRWEDVRAGDAVELGVAKDHIDKQVYCLEICIKRRPKGTLPESQKEDPQFPRFRLMNDLENGVDVSDEEIIKVCPPLKEVRDRRTGELIQTASPGGLNKEWQNKLDAIREKKAKEAKDKDLKASPPPLQKK